MWTDDADDRAFLHELAYEVIAASAPEELAEFDQLVAAYVTHPAPLLLGPTSRPPARRAQLTPAAPAVITAVLNLLLSEIQAAAQYDQVEVIKLGLKRLFRQRTMHPNERVIFRAGSKLQPAELVVFIYLYTLPVGISLPLSRLVDLAFATARAYGLTAEQADTLVSLATARLILGPLAFWDREQE